MAKTTKKILIPLLAMALVVGGLGVAATSANAATTPSTQSTHTNSAHNRNRGKGVMGTVASINGNTLTVTGKIGPKSTATAVTYTVDATNAKVMKSATSGAKPTTVTIADIQVGDTIMVQGTVNGTSVTAISIFDGKFTPRSPGTNPASKSSFGHGVVGTVSAIDGTTLTVAGKTGPKSTATAVTYTIDASNAKITKRVAGTTPTAPTTIAVSAIQVGDKVMVRGTVNGTSVTATNIVDGLMQGFRGKSTSTK